MANSNPPVKGQAFTFFASLADAADPKSFKANPTIAAGDFKVSIDGGAFANLATLPAVTPAGGIGVQVDLSAAEMAGDQVLFTGIDQTATKEWADISICILTTSG